MNKDTLVIVGREIAKAASSYYDVYAIFNSSNVKVIKKNGKFDVVVRTLRALEGISNKYIRIQYGMRFSEFIVYIRSRWNHDGIGYVIPRWYEKQLRRNNPDMAFKCNHMNYVISDNFINSVMTGTYCGTSVKPYKTDKPKINTKTIVNRVKEINTAIQNTESMKIVKGMQYAGKEMYIKDINGNFTKARVIGYYKYNGTDYQFAVIMRDSQGNAKIKMINTIYEYECVPAYKAIKI